jgi:homoserine kinase type II
VGNELTGVIDFYNACNGYFIYDLAIMVNDWCINNDGTIDPSRYSAMINAYKAVRAFTPEEHQHWQTMLRGGALRFWTSRLVSMHLPEDLHKKGALTQFKDPEHFKRILQNRIQQSYSLT